MINLIALIICLLGAVAQGIRGDVGMVVFQIMLALINLPFVIIWFAER